MSVEEKVEKKMPFFNVCHGMDESTLFSTQCSVGALTTHLSKLTSELFSRVELLPLSFASDLHNNTKLAHALRQLDEERRDPSAAAVPSALGSNAQVNLVNAAMHNIPFVGLLVTPVQASVNEQLATAITANGSYVLVGFREAEKQREVEAVEGSASLQALLRRANAAGVQQHPEMAFITNTAFSWCDVSDLSTIYEEPVVAKGAAEEVRYGPRMLLTRTISRDEELAAERERLAAQAASEEVGAPSGRRKSTRRGSKLNVYASVDDEEEKKAKDLPLSSSAAALLSIQGTAQSPLVVNMNTCAVTVKLACVQNGTRRHVLETVSDVEVLWSGPKGEGATLQLFLNEYLIQMKAKIEAAQLQIAVALEGSEHNDKKKKGKK